MLEQMKILWPICVAVVSFTVYKFIPYLRTKIVKYKFENMELVEALIGYELVGEFFVLLVGLDMALLFGKSTKDNMIMKEYVCAWGLLSIIYLIGIFILLHNKGEKRLPKVAYTIILGAVFDSAFFIQLYVSLQDTYDERNDWFFYAVIFIILISQVLINLKMTQEKKVKYIVYISEQEMYKTTYEPVKRGNYYYITLLNDEKKEGEIIQIPEKDVKRIKYIIEYIKEEQDTICKKDISKEARRKAIENFSENERKY